MKQKSLKLTFDGVWILFSNLEKFFAEMIVLYTKPYYVYVNTGVRVVWHQNKCGIHFRAIQPNPKN